MKGRETIYRAQYVLSQGRFLRDGAIAVQDGEIQALLSAEDVADLQAAGPDRVVDLGRVALIPGQINVHSHAFQRALRGKTEYREPSRGGDNFWTWRQGMYRLANRVEPDEMETIAEAAYWEMLRAGITHVGEFHYVHHGRDGRPYADRNEMALRIAKVAQELGIRVTLLPVAYHTGDIGEPALAEQRRFLSPDVESYLAQVQALREAVKAMPLVQVGLAPHSIRAVPKEWMEAIAAFGKAEGLPVHIHVCEQRREVEASRKAYGMPPVEALYEWGVLDESWTLIHGTHLSARELEILEEVRPTIGACPTTERNLGDGILPARSLVERQVPIALGSDSHTMIDPFCEMRLVEYHERLIREERNVLSAVDGQQRLKTADILWEMGTKSGARSLNTGGGELAAGAVADFVAVDLEHPSLLGATGSTLLTDIVLSMSAAAVRDVFVAGRPLVAARFHGKEHEIIEEYRQLMQKYAQ